jgi:two-component system, NarL family, response regulator DevR
VIRVFLLDDHDGVRRAIADLLAGSTDIEIVGESGSAATAVGLILATRPQVMIVDRQLSDGNGIDVCRTVRRADPAIRGIILTAYANGQDMRAAAGAGASGCLVKQLRGVDLVDAIRRVAAGGVIDDAVVLAASAGTQG